jgi:deoxyribodipyrimidine photo-lyase
MFVLATVSRQSPCDDPAGVPGRGTGNPLERRSVFRVVQCFRRCVLPLSGFEPTDAALAKRLQAVDPCAYARTRNAFGGRITRLSPDLTHRFTDVRAVENDLRARVPLPEGHKLLFELAWREYFHHLWRHLGEGIFDDRRPAHGTGYTRALPEDIRCGATGVPVVDRAVRELYCSGYLHNHARMWLAA